MALIRIDPPLLIEEHGLVIPYASLTRRLRELGLGRTDLKKRCDRRTEEPGMEMQHDTSVYRLLIGGVWRKVIAGLLYLRYSKRRYLKLYSTAS